MTKEEIIKAVDEGKTVCWVNDGYRVIKDKAGYLVTFIPNGSSIGLIRSNGTLNGEEDEFYIKEI